jgi:hypothetical protein
MRRFVVLLLAVCLLACSGPLPQAPSASAAGSGRPEPVRLWQDASIFTLIGNLITTSQRRVLVEVYELGRSGRIS